MARGLIADARHAALCGPRPRDGRAHGHADRAGSRPRRRHRLTLISTLSSHTAALAENPACSLLIGEPGAKGDPLTHPRLTLQARAEPADKAALRDHYLSLYPKATLYYDFGDFGLTRFAPVAGFLNGGFGKAYRLSPADLLP